MNRDHGLWMKEFDGLSCVLWPHNEMFPDRQKCQIDRHIVPDQFHIRKQSGITGVKDSFNFQLNNCFHKLTQEERNTVLVGNGGAMGRLSIFKGAERIFAPATM